jgi:hypothetical protein
MFMIEASRGDAKIVRAQIEEMIQHSRHLVFRQLDARGVF